MSAKQRVFIVFLEKQIIYWLVRQACVKTAEKCNCILYYATGLGEQIAILSIPEVFKNNMKTLSFIFYTILTFSTVK